MVPYLCSGLNKNDSFKIRLEMKNKILAIMICTLTTLSLVSCDESTDGYTRITYYPSITILGESSVVVYVGETYVDEGCLVELNGEDATDQAIIKSTVNTSTPGIYSVTYSAVNEDGFAKSASRTVIVANQGHFATVYEGESQYGTRHYYGAPIIISEHTGGNFLIDDLMGGFYFHGRYPGYEPTYDFHAEAILTLEADNSITLGTVGSWYFSSTTATITTSEYDPATGNIALVLDFGGTPFYVNLTPVTK
jgi:hypothetical protein